MPREDYEQFIKIMSHKKHPIYKLLAIECTKGYPYTFAKVVDTRTRLVEEIGKDLHQMGVFIDIFPMRDGKSKRESNAAFDEDYSFTQQNLGSSAEKR